MINMNKIISNNILNLMKQNNKKQIDLAVYLGVSKQIIIKMLSGARMINAVELQKIAKFLEVSMEDLVKIHYVILEMNTFRAFMKRVESQEAKRGLEIADEIANLICYYARVQDEAEEMMQAWEP